MLIRQIAGRRQFLVTTALAFLSTRALRGDDSISSEIQPTFLDWQTHIEQGEFFEHWTPEKNGEWDWYRLERFADGEPRTAGITLPMNAHTGQPFEPAEGYLGIERIPSYVLSGEIPPLEQRLKSRMAPSLFDAETQTLHAPDPERRIRDGRPPSDWLVSLYAEELRSWLTSIDVPEAAVKGMTQWVHLIRDHHFDPRRIEGLTEAEFARLHSAAHEGY